MRAFPKSASDIEVHQDMIAKGETTRTDKLQSAVTKLADGVSYLLIMHHLRCARQRADRSCGSKADQDQPI